MKKINKSSILIIFRILLVDCVWEQWMSWGPCSASCLGGIQFRSRNYISQQYGGKPCNGATTESQECNMESCKYIKKDMVWGIVVDDTENWSLDKMSKCCCDISPSYAVIEMDICLVLLEFPFEIV